VQPQDGVTNDAETIGNSVNGDGADVRRQSEHRVRALKMVTGNGWDLSHGQ